MADIKQIKVGDITYDVKDASARARLDELEDWKEALLNTIFPIGFTMLSKNPNFNPNNVYPGTWTKVSAGKAIVGVDPNSSITALKTPAGAGTTTSSFGQADGTLGSHTHTVPAHSHTMGSHSHTASGWNFSVYKGTRSGETVGGIGGSGYLMTQVKSGGSWGGLSSTAAANPGNTSTVAATAVNTVGSALSNVNYQPSQAYNIWERTA